MHHNLTVAGIRKLLDENDKAVFRGVVAIYKEQTRDEQQAWATKHANGVGYSASDAKKMTSYAKDLLAGRQLNEAETADCRRVIKKYARQLQVIAFANLVNEKVFS